jgi:hypothetical protein
MLLSNLVALILAFLLCPLDSRSVHCLALIRV